MGCQACGSWSYNDQCDNDGCECPCHTYDTAPAMPGDILAYKDGTSRQIVAHAKVESGTRSRRCGCGGCTEDYAEVHIWVFAEEPELVIAKGGGCHWILPVEKFSETWGWPPKDHRLLRDGEVLWEPKSKVEEAIPA